MSSRARVSATSSESNRFFKTKLCKHFTKGYCRFQDACAFAHQLDELVYRPDLTRTKWCARYLAGTCTTRNCSFAHSADELRSRDELGSSSVAMIASLGADDDRLLRRPPDQTHDVERVPVYSLPPPPARWLRRSADISPEVGQVLRGQQEAPGFPRWAAMSRGILQWKRRRILHIGRLLLLRSRQTSFTKLELDHLAAMLLEDAAWVQDFKLLARRCSRLLLSPVESIAV
mmetsp:Transcript_25375/g.58868  ORF Transcript_25375/g.58868 Transcript_25375/m.58868 type:complete len:231 (+) Transcript_25375:69-761(+)